MKMETPKMDVVRFKEADVIVASNGPVSPEFSADLSRAGGDAKDMSLAIVHGENAYTYDYQKLWDERDSGLLASISFNNGTNTKSLIQLLDDDVNNGAFDGHYISYNGSAYTKQ